MRGWWEDGVTQLTRAGALGWRVTSGGECSSQNDKAVGSSLGSDETVGQRLGVAGAPDHEQHLSWVTLKAQPDVVERLLGIRRLDAHDLAAQTH